MRLVSGTHFLFTQSVSPPGPALSSPEIELQDVDRCSGPDGNGARQALEVGNIFDGLIGEPAARAELTAREVDPRVEMPIMRFVLCSALLVSLALATEASGTISLRASCSGDQVTVYIGVCNDYPEEFTGFVIQRREVGTCAGPVIITDAPVPLPAPGNPYLSGDWVHYEFVFAVPFPGIHYQYSALLSDADGQIHEYGNPPFPTWDCKPVLSDVTSCEDAVIMRGHVVPTAWYPTQVTVLIIPCAEGCWGLNVMMLDVPLDNPLVTSLNSGVVDIYGAVNDIRCFGEWGLPYLVSRVEPAPNGACGPVPEKSTSFGSLKAMYR